MGTIGGRGEVCGVPWAICPFCADGLTSSGGQSWCTNVEEGCLAALGYDMTGTGWPTADREPCADSATVEIVDHEGTHAWVCAAHGRYWHRHSTPPPAPAPTV